jgi:hypothetical protein
MDEAKSSVFAGAFIAVEDPVSSDELSDASEILQIGPELKAFHSTRRF